MSQYNLERIFKPRRVAVVGASEKTGGIGRNASVFWESERNMDMVATFLKTKKQIDKTKHPELDRWIDWFTKDCHGAAYEFWYEMHKGAHELLREFPG